MSVDCNSRLKNNDLKTKTITLRLMNNDLKTQKQCLQTSRTLTVECNSIQDSRTVWTAIQDLRIMWTAIQDLTIMWTAIQDLRIMTVI